MPRRSLEQRAALVEQWRASGLSAFAFAKQHGFSPQSLARWAARLDPASETSASEPLTFARLRSSSSAGLVVEVGSARVRVEPGFDPALLRAVLAALVESPTP